MSAGRVVRKPVQCSGREKGGGEYGGGGGIEGVRERPSKHGGPHSLNRVGVQWGNQGLQQKVGLHHPDYG